MGIATDWGVSALCVNGAFAKHLVYEVSSDTADAGDLDEDDTDCPGHNGLVGGGTRIVGRGGSNLNATFPDADDEWMSYVDATGLTAVSYKTYAICFKNRATTTGGGR